jgi:hypothetical protein
MKLALGVFGRRVAGSFRIAVSFGYGFDFGRLGVVANEMMIPRFLGGFVLVRFFAAFIMMFERVFVSFIALQSAVFLHAHSLFALCFSHLLG